MFAVIYQIYLKPGSEEPFRKYWTEVASYFVDERGALGSTLHKTEEGMWVAYSRWPDKATRDASWPQEGAEVSSAISPAMRQAIEGLKECIEKRLPEVCMKIEEEIF